MTTLTLLTAEARQAMRQWAQITPDYDGWRDKLLRALDDIDERERQAFERVRRATAALSERLAHAERERDEARAECARLTARDHA